MFLLNSPFIHRGRRNPQHERDSGTRVGVRITAGSRSVTLSLSGSTGTMRFQLPQFVDNIATRSSISGKPYQVKFEDGSTIELAKWLRTSPTTGPSSQPASR